jgi:hypothetical protein
MVIAQNNKFNNIWVDKVINIMQTSNTTTVCNTPENKKKYVTFTCAGKEVYHVTRLFEELNVGIACKTNNNIGKCLSKLHGSTTYSEYQNSGVYQLQYPDSDLDYTGQTGRYPKLGIESTDCHTKMGIICRHLPNT